MGKFRRLSGTLTCVVWSVNGRVRVGLALLGRVTLVRLFPMLDSIIGIFVSDSDLVRARSAIAPLALAVFVTSLRWPVWCNSRRRGLVRLGLVLLSRTYLWLRLMMCCSGALGDVFRLVGRVVLDGAGAGLAMVTSACRVRGKYSLPCVLG